MYNKLYFIGNGFDLHCGLKSSFSDFYKFECQKYMKVDNIEEYEILNMDRNLHDINFYILMMSIFKNCYNDFINTFRLNKVVFNNNVINWSDFEQNLFYILSNSILYSKLKQIYDKELNNDEGLFYSFFKYFDMWKSKNGNTKFNDFLYLQLNNFEKEFTNYMINQINNSEYKEEKQQLIEMLQIDYHSYVLNFNYTSLNDSPKNINENNIHGNLKDNNIIIGIDDFNIVSDSKKDSNEYIDLFSKTTRIMMHQNKYDLRNNLPLNINEIIFYGHSLNKQDYSYFQSVFDHYNIYSSNLKLKFYYSDDYVNSQNERDKIKLQQLHNIKRLLSEYGKTLDNKDHGKNLMHKLALENRLFLDKI